MSRSPERMSSYRRHFEGALASSSSTCNIRVSSPSPRRRETRHRSASYSRSSRRAVSGTRTTRLSSSVSMGALCVGMGLGALDLEAAAAANQAFLSTRTSERKEMITLNDRLAVYIEKVRSLEQQNKLLETEIEALKGRYVKPSGLRMMYEEQLRELRRIADQMQVQKNLAIAAKEAMAMQLEMIKAKYEESLEARKKAELDIEAFKPDVDAATAARIALEKQLENLEVEMEFLQRIQKQEIEELMAQIYQTVAKVDVAFALPDLASALKEIQSQYDCIAARNLQEMDTWYKTKFQDLNTASTRHVESVRGIREEVVSYKKDIQNKQRELDALNTKYETLQAQINDNQEKYSKVEQNLQAHIEALKLDMKTVKEKIALLLKEYQDLLNLKMALEIEITTYRKLIEGEDTRLSAMVQGLPLLGLCASESVSASGGVSISGGVSALRGISTSGGVSASEGVSASGGISTSGGVSASEGVSASGGVSISGGVSALSGISTSGGVSASEGVSASGGISTSGGVSASEGYSASGGGTAEARVSGVLAGKIDGATTASPKMSSSNSLQETAEGFTQEQAVEMTERKTVLIRTVKTEDDIIQRDTQERTITISGAADETDE